MAASVGETSMKQQAKNKDSSQQTLTINFIPETERYAKPNNMEEYIRSYFEGINGINRRIIAEERKIIAQNRNTWPSLSVEERDELLNDRFISSDIRTKYNTNDEYWKERTPWQPESLNSSEDSTPCPREERTDSMTLNDSFSKPFHWATKSQRNLKFPAIKREKPKISEEKSEKTDPKSIKTPELKETKTEGETAKKLNNVEQSLKEKQIKTTNENIKGKMVTNKLEDKPKTSTSKSNENINEVNDEEMTSSTEQPKSDGSENIDESKNIFEFLQSWNP
ncbi:uncharacterized protein LOC114522173 [Dendronephthya gigantea]|uniref:uncharacterized protein LOC114522173 n=1 Tax=Dendronephthya gigantea TaxID=151771 RepID=UPI00106A11D0|nr:uncharacterized protein LOC114522173 [Dendronephthya gigantea]